MTTRLTGNPLSRFPNVELTRLKLQALRSGDLDHAEAIEQEQRRRSTAFGLRIFPSLLK